MVSTGTNSDYLNFVRHNLKALPCYHGLSKHDHKDLGHPYEMDRVEISKPTPAKITQCQVPVFWLSKYIN
jgi:hypothetical protein